MKILAVIAGMGVTLEREIRQVSSLLYSDSCGGLFEKAAVEYLVLTGGDEAPGEVFAEENAGFFCTFLPENVEERCIVTLMEKWNDRKQYDYILFGSSVRERNMAAVFAARTGRKLLTNVGEMRVSGGEGKWCRDIFLGNLTAEYPMTNYTVITLAKHADMTFSDRCRPVWAEEVMAAETMASVKNYSRRKKEVSVGWETADRIIVIGNGVDHAGFHLVEEFAKRIHAEIAGTRRAVENGLLPVERMIGISGKSIAPKICIVIGASGLEAFVKGIEKSGMIVAINSDKDALIFNCSDYGIVQKYQDFVRQYRKEVSSSEFSTH